MSLDTMTAMAADYRAAAEAAGRTPHVTSIRFCWPYRSRAAALEKFGDTALAMARTLFDYGAITDLPGVTSSAEITLEEFVRDRFVFGTPEECVETIGRFRDQAGVDDFLTIFRYPTGPDHAAVLEAMELFGTEVLPNLAASHGPRVRVGVVGASYASGTHLPVYAELAAAGVIELVAVATAHRETADAVAAKFDVPHAHVGFEALCADPDVDLVDIATRPSRHRAMAEAAFAAGKDVLCEAPLASTLDDGLAMAAAAAGAARGRGHAVAVPAGPRRAAQAGVGRLRRARGQRGGACALPDVHATGRGRGIGLVRRRGERRQLAAGARPAHRRRAALDVR